MRVAMKGATLSVHLEEDEVDKVEYPPIQAKQIILKSLGVSTAMEVEVPYHSKLGNNLGAQISLLKALHPLISNDIERKQMQRAFREVVKRYDRR